MAHLLTGNKFDPEKDIPELSGKIYILTGGTAGIGLGITAHLLSHNASRILLISQNHSHFLEALDVLKAYGDTDRVEFVQCDFRDLKGTDEVGGRLRRELGKGGMGRVDALICNAGEGVGKYNETVDGLDSHFQVNHLSQHLLTLHLLPLLLRNPNSRLVFQSSDLHRLPSPTPTSFTSPSELSTDIGPMHLYARTKLAQILFVRGLVRRLQGKGVLGGEGEGKDGKGGIWINATHPGGVETDQQKQAVDAYGVKGKVGVAAVKPLLKDPLDEGCRPALFAATSEDVVKENIQGCYIVPDRKVTEPSKEARDEALGENLWRLSEQMLVEKLGGLPYEVV